MFMTDTELAGMYLACKRELIKRARDNYDLATMNTFASTYFYELGMLEIMLGNFIYECDDGVEIDGVNYKISR